MNIEGYWRAVSKRGQDGWVWTSKVEATSGNQLPNQYFFPWTISDILQRNFAPPQTLPASTSTEDLRNRLGFKPAHIYAIAENYVSEDAPPTGSSGLPLVFTKTQDAIIDEDKPVKISHLLANEGRVWGECELAAILGGSGEVIAVTLANDVTMDIPGCDQDHHLPYFKSQRGFCPLSSILLSPAVLESYKLEGLHNGKLLRSGTEKQQKLGSEGILKFLRGWTSLGEWDVVLLGAPRRVREREYLRSNDSFTTLLNGWIELHTLFE